MNELFLRTNDLNHTGAIDYIRESIGTYIRSNFVLGAEETLENNASLLETGVIDSTSALELVEFIEETFKIQIADSDLDHENFDTIDRIAQFITSRITPRPAA
jgi:acyl carrier protein